MFLKTSLADARKVHDGVESFLAKGINPMEHKKHVESLMQSNQSRIVLKP